MRNQRSSWTAPSIKFHLIFVARLYISGFGQIEEKKWCKVITCRSCSTYSHHKASSNTINNILLCESSRVKSLQIKSSRVWAESSLLPRRANICRIGMSICSMTWIFFFRIAGRYYHICIYDTLHFENENYQHHKVTNYTYYTNSSSCVLAISF